jgi:hypothetical protein
MQSHHVAAFTIAAVLMTVALATSMAPAEARGGGHGFHRGGLSGRSAHVAGDRHSFAGDRRHADDAYVKAAEDENDKLLATKLKSICRGC